MLEEHLTTFSHYKKLGWAPGAPAPPCAPRPDVAGFSSDAPARDGSFLKGFFGSPVPASAQDRPRRLAHVHCLSSAQTARRSPLPLPVVRRP